MISVTFVDGICDHEWPDPGDIDHVCVSDRDHAGDHQCVCGARTQ